MLRLVPFPAAGPADLRTWPSVVLLRNRPSALITFRGAFKNVVMVFAESFASLWSTANRTYGRTLCSGIALATHSWLFCLGIFCQQSPTASTRNIFRNRFSRSGVIPFLSVVFFTQPATPLRLPAFPAQDNFLREFMDPTMKSVVIRYAVNKFKILNTVIFFISVFVVDNLRFKKRSFQVLRHYKSVLKYLTVFPRIWMLPGWNKHISVTGLNHCGMLV
jgi:hypothetical protein